VKTERTIQWRERESLKLRGKAEQRLIFHAEIDTSCSTISLRRSECYSGDLVEEK
jgi:hypothetical protein